MTGDGPATALVRYRMFFEIRCIPILRRRRFRL